MKTLRLILGDQLNYNHSWYRKKSDNVIYIIMEMRQETDYVVHHAQKLIAFFASMYNFQNFLSKKGHNVIYLKINDNKNKQDLKVNLIEIIRKYKIQHFEYQEPDEYRLDFQLKNFCSEIKITSKVYGTEHFLSVRNELSNFFSGKKTFLMESFYRNMRKKHNVLMNGENPIGEKWNFDTDNRKPFKGKLSSNIQKIKHKNYSDIWCEIQKSGIKYLGKPDEKFFSWPTTRKESLEILNHFVDKLLPYFGTYQDAMTQQDWVLYHSRLSFSLNTKMISPYEVISAVENKFRKDPNHAGISQVEGFIRQVLGWREYMRGIYWAKMPEFADMNFFYNKSKLPAWFWNGDTKMNCLSNVIKQSLDHAYAHHIQRLMVTGNFSLLAGINPDEVDQWYLGIYIDAIEWVEITNTRGMSQYADGGIVGSKPYVSSAAYINKMSDYCKTCHYKSKEKFGPQACPFNSLYWNFYDKNRGLLEHNPRIGMMYKVWDKMELNQKVKILEQAKIILESINEI
jgi:deoxyribodipyrimidine photolyase-related protein